MTRLIIDTKKIEENIKIVKKYAKDSKIYWVLKGNAYGMGAVETARVLLKNSESSFAVSRIEEAVELRQNGIDSEILVMCSTSVEQEIQTLIDNHLTATVGSLGAMLALDGALRRDGVTLNAHIALDTGIGRYGFLPSDINDLTAAVLNLTNLKITGIFTHLSTAFGKKAYSQKQFDVFNQMVEFLKNSGIEIPCKHILNSNGLFRFDDMRLDAVRVGSVLTGRVLKGKGLSPVGTLECTIQEIKNLDSGCNVGYGNAFKLKKNATIAVVPVGTSDGIGLEKAKGLFRFIDKLRYVKSDLLLSKKSRISCKINDKKVYILARPFMTSLVLDVTDIPCKAGDKCYFNVNPMFINSSVERDYI